MAGIQGAFHLKFTVALRRHAKVEGWRTPKGEKKNYALRFALYYASTPKSIV